MSTTENIHIYLKSIQVFCIFISLVFFNIVFFQTNVYGYGENTMQPLYNLNKALMPKLEPKIYSTKKNEIEGLFDVPVDNAIATHQIGNAITLLNFNRKK